MIRNYKAILSSMLILILIFSMLPTGILANGEGLDANLTASDAASPETPGGPADLPTDSNTVPPATNQNPGAPVPGDTTDIENKVPEDITANPGAGGDETNPLLGPVNTAIETLVQAADISVQGTNMSIMPTVDRTTAKPGETITYKLTYGISSTTGVLNGGKIVDTLPPELVYVGATTSVDMDSYTADATTGIVTFNMKDGLASGRTGFVLVQAKFREGITPNGTTAVDHVQISGTDVPPTAVDAPPVTAVTTASNWSLAKTKVMPTINPVPGSDVKYLIRVTGNASTGLHIKEVTVTDTLPVGAVLIPGGTTAGYTYNEENRTVVWLLATLNVGATKDYYVTVQYPADAFLLPTTVTNTATAEGKDYFDGALPSLSKSVSHGLATPAPAVGALSKQTRQSGDRYAVGQSVYYKIQGFNNTGNVPLSNLTIEDAVPDQIDLTKITSGKFSGATGTIRIEYQSKNGGDIWTSWLPAGNPAVQTTLLVSNLGLAPGDYVTRIRWTLSEVPVGFAVATAIELWGTLLATDHAGAPLQYEVPFSNTAVLDVYDGLNRLNPGGAHTATSSVSVTPVEDPSKKPWIQATKTVSPTSARIGDTVTYTLSVKNHSYATGNLGNPVVVDVLPTWLAYTGVVAGTPAPTVLEGGKLQWNLESVNLTPGQTKELKITCKVQDMTPNKKWTNPMYIMTSEAVNDSRSAMIDDTGDIDGNPSTTKMVKSTVDLYVKFQGTVESEKLVKGNRDPGFSKFPESGYADGVSGKTPAGGKALYRLNIKNPNSSNGPITNIVLIDILPRVGDIGVIDTSARESGWRPYLVEGVTGEDGGPLPAGAQILYSLEDSPNLADLFTPLGTNNAGWTTAVPANITDVKALKIDLGTYSLPAGETLTLEWQMRTPVGVASGLIAWNSFGYNATYTDETGQAAFAPAEPKMVGFQVVPPDPEKCQLGDFIWEDKNRNGIQEAGETGVNNVLVRLLDSGLNEVGYTRTGDNAAGQPGYYGFPDLDAGTYTVEYVMPEGYYPVSSNQGVDDNADSDFTLHLGNAYRTTVTLTEGENYTIDAGLYRKASLGDRIWNDRNKNGIQDSGEVGMSGVTVELWQEEAKLATAVTDADGLYRFANLDPGIYKVKGVCPAGYGQSPSLRGNEPAADSDFDLSDGFSGPVTLHSNEAYSDTDGGFYLAEAGDRIWIDANRNGIQDSGETGKSGITVNLYGAGGLLKTVTTDSAGNYLFKDLPSGTFTVEYLLPAGWYAVGTDVGADDGADSDFNLFNDAQRTYRADVTLDVGQRVLTLDGGIYQKASLGDLVWHDKNKNGIQDAAEPGIANARVELWQGGVMLGFQMTSVTGLYEFTGLEPGVYSAKLITPDGYAVSPKDAGADTVDSDFDQESGWSANVTLVSGERNLKLDGGLFLAQIGDRVWHDLNRNGIQDAGEPGISNVTLKLYSGAGPVLQTVQTDANGNYSLMDLPTGTYRIEITKPGGYTAFSPTDQGADDSLDSDGTWTSSTASFASIQNISVAAGGVNLTLDTGLYNMAKVGDTVFTDDNRNGIQDVGEIGLAGVSVTLKTSAGVTVAETVTDADGHYSFESLEPGNYVITVVKPLMTDPTWDLDGGLDCKASFVLLSGDNRVDVDFGFVPLPHLTVTKAADRSTVRPGDLVTFVVKIINDGKVKLTELRFTDPLVGVEKTYPELNIGETLTETVTYTVKAGDYPGPLTNTAFGKSLQTTTGSATVSLGVELPPASGGGGGTPPKDPAEPPVVPPPVVVPGTPNPPVTPGTPPTPPVTPPVVAPPGDTPQPVPIIIDDKIPQGPVKITVPEHGVVRVNPDGHYVYVPNPGFTGKDTFTVTAILPDGTEKSELIEIEVEDVALGVVKLPTTGEWPQMVFYGLGGLLLILGTAMKIRFTIKQP